LTSKEGLEFMRKMTTDELDLFDKEIGEKLLSKGVEQKIPEWAAGYIAEYIDYEILYTIIRNTNNGSI
jgi:hypothetical protein